MARHFGEACKHCHYKKAVHSANAEDFDVNLCDFGFSANRLSRKRLRLIKVLLTIRKLGGPTAGAALVSLALAFPSRAQTAGGTGGGIGTIDYAGGGAGGSGFSGMPGGQGVEGARDHDRSIGPGRSKSVAG